MRLSPLTTAFTCTHALLNWEYPHKRSKQIHTMEAYLTNCTQCHILVDLKGVIWHRDTISKTGNTKRGKSKILMGLSYLVDHW